MVNTVDPVIDSFGTKYWETPELGYHRIGGPAVIYVDGIEEWWVDNKRHRIDGPALVSVDDYIWCVNGKVYVSNEEYQEAAGLSDEEMTIIVLKYGNVS